MTKQVSAQKEKMTEDKIPEQSRDFVKVFAKESFEKESFDSFAGEKAVGSHNRT
jgi:hypothetical protein